MYTIFAIISLCKSLGMTRVIPCGENGLFISFPIEKYIGTPTFSAFHDRTTANHYIVTYYQFDDSFNVHMHQYNGYDLKEAIKAVYRGLRVMHRREAKY